MNQEITKAKSKNFSLDATVHSHVRFQISFLCKPSSTKITAVRVLLVLGAMYSQMCLKSKNHWLENNW